MKFGSVCSGIEAASLAFKEIGMKASWFSEISEFPSKVLNHHHPEIKNLGDMIHIPELIKEEKIEAPDILCGGTPCQAFSLAGLKEGLADDRGQLTLKFIEIANAIDEIRTKNKKDKSIILWENVEGVLKDKTNAFGIFIAGLAGLDEAINEKKFSNAGVLYGPTRNVAWRVLDAKYFGLPQQRKRLFVVATDIEINPELILFETTNDHSILNKSKALYSKKEILTQEDTLPLFSTSSNLVINNKKYEFFREYTDCLYSAYGTKWNGNAAAYNGSLYISENDKVRRLTPLECERLMGFPDNYTLIPGSRDTTRFQAIGNSWAIPVIQWLGNRIYNHKKLIENNNHSIKSFNATVNGQDIRLYQFSNEIHPLSNGIFLNTSTAPNKIKKGNIFDVVQTDSPEKFFITPKGAAGILRRKHEKNINMHSSLEKLFTKHTNNIDSSC